MSSQVLWVLYLLECRGGSLYAGITNNMEARFKAHRDGKGAKYTRANPPIRIVATRVYASKSDALKAEIALKRLPRTRKTSFFAEDAS